MGIFHVQFEKPGDVVIFVKTSKPSTMEEQMEEQAQLVHNLYIASKNLRELHEDVSFYEHALTRSRTVKPASPFIPTFFLYIIFAFNTIFSIDWRSSLKTGKIEEHNKYNERKRINKLISFCFSDPAFVSLFYPAFLEILCMRFNKEDIILALDGIIVDGVKVTEDDKRNAIDACNKLFTEEGFTFQNGRFAKAFCSFIYQVRCNIVHGTKLTEQMADPEQQNRILIYSYFLIAIQHMLFMYIEDLEEGFFSSQSESFIRRLRDSHR